MRKVLIVLFCFIITNCKRKNVPEFEPSFKSIKSEKKKILEYLDTVNNVYSNFKYNVSFKIPKNWSFDEGNTEHSIMRAVKKDSLFYFTMNVIETSYNVEKNFWKSYEENRKEFELKSKKAMEVKLNTTIRDYKNEIIYLRNYKTIRKEFLFDIRHQDYIYEYKGIMHQIGIGNFTYSFGITLPKIFFDINPNQHYYFFDNVEFLADKKKIKNLLK